MKIRWPFMLKKTHEKEMVFFGLMWKDRVKNQDKATLDRTIVISEGMPKVRLMGGIGGNMVVNELQQFKGGHTFDFELIAWWGRNAKLDEVARKIAGDFVKQCNCILRKSEKDV